jgi:hypothetical protein
MNVYLHWITQISGRSVVCNLWNSQDIVKYINSSENKAHMTKKLDTCLCIYPLLSLH